MAHLLIPVKGFNKTSSTAISTSYNKFWMGGSDVDGFLMQGRKRTPWQPVARIVGSHPRVLEILVESHGVSCGGAPQWGVQSWVPHKKAKQALVKYDGGSPKGALERLD